MNFFAQDRDSQLFPVFGKNGEFLPEIHDVFFAQHRDPRDIRFFNLFDENGSFVEEVNDEVNIAVTNFLFKKAIPHFKSLDPMGNPNQEEIFYKGLDFSMIAVLEKDDVFLTPGEFNLPFLMTENDAPDFSFYIAESIYIFRITLEYYFDVRKPDGTMSPKKHYALPFL